jgi:hypothetical protein
MDGEVIKATHNGLDGHQTLLTMLLSTVVLFLFSEHMRLINFNFSRYPPGWPCGLPSRGAWPLHPVMSCHPPMRLPPSRGKNKRLNANGRDSVAASTPTDVGVASKTKNLGGLSIDSDIFGKIQLPKNVFRSIGFAIYLHISTHLCLLPLSLSHRLFHSNTGQTAPRYHHSLKHGILNTRCIGATFLNGSCTSHTCMLGC